MSDDPMIEAMAQLMATVLAMHMRPEPLARCANAATAAAERQEAIDAAGAVVFGSGDDHKPAVFRALARLYSMGHSAALERARTSAEPKPAHVHGYRNGVAIEPGE